MSIEDTDVIIEDSNLSIKGRNTSIEVSQIVMSV